MVSVPFPREHGFSGGINLTEYRAPDPGDSGGLSLGQHEGVETTPTTRTSNAHVKPTPSSGSFGLLRTGYVPGSPDPFDGDNGCRLMGSHDSVKAPATETARKDGVQTAPAIGTSVKATNFGYDTLFRRFSLVSSDPISKSVVLGPLCGRIYLLTTRVRLAQKGDMFFDSEDQNPSVEVIPMVSLLPADELHPLFGSLALLGTLAKLSELRGGESTLGQWVSEARGSGSVMGLSAGKDAVFEEVQGKVALFWVSPPFRSGLFPPVSSPLGSSFTVGLWVSQQFSFQGRDLLRSVSTYGVERSGGQIGHQKDIMPKVWGITIGAAVSAQLRLLCFYPYWAVIGFVGSGL